MVPGNSYLCSTFFSPDMLFQVKFHLLNHQVLFSASRRSNLIKCWDLRYAATSFHTFHRPGLTNQKISFDIDYSGLNLATGAQVSKKLIRLWTDHHNFLSPGYLLNHLIIFSGREYSNLPARHFGSEASPKNTLTLGSVRMFLFLS